MEKSITISAATFNQLLSAKAQINDLRALACEYAPQLRAVGVLDKINAILRHNVYGGEGDADTDSI